MRAVELKQEIYDMLLRVSPACASQWRTLFLEPIEGRPFQEQVVAVNSFWRVQLGMLKESTINEREYLMNDLTVDQWLLRFERHVVPTIVRHQLPRRVQ